ncbi:MAG: DUF3300 domain-containing protein [Comamonadaceae bacterium]|nr:DUF3300 domain-containing protein [Comamonadaceae bacterium]
MTGHALVFAQGSDAQKKFKQEELEQMLAPVALYPDSILTQILMASTYPLEVVQAERWVKQNKSLKGDTLKKALEKQSWDASVKALVAFPDVLTMMSEKLDWTQKVGDAFLAQQKEVMDTVQKLRAKAVAEGNLKSLQGAGSEKGGQHHYYSAHQSPSGLCSGLQSHRGLWRMGVSGLSASPGLRLSSGAAAFTFAMGAVVGAAWHGHGHHAEWHGEASILTETSISTLTGRGRKPAGGAREQWKHNPEHRQGVAYRDQKTRDRYSPANRAGVESRKGSRGYNKPGVSTADRGAGKGPAVSQRDNRDSAFGGSDRGKDIRQQSDRGRSSRESMNSSSGRSKGSGISSGGRTSGGGNRRGGRR